MWEVFLLFSPLFSEFETNFLKSYLKTGQSISYGVTAILTVSQMSSVCEHVSH